jgi:hypothetical protein
MRTLAVLALIICQFTAFPFLAIVSANTARHHAELVQHADVPGGTTIYKSTQSL